MNDCYINASRGTGAPHRSPACTEITESFMCRGARASIIHICSLHRAEGAQGKEVSDREGGGAWQPGRVESSPLHCSPLPFFPSSLPPIVFTHQLACTICRPPFNIGYLFSQYKDHPSAPVSPVPTSRARARGSTHVRFAPLS